MRRERTHEHIPAVPIPAVRLLEDHRRPPRRIKVRLDIPLLLPGPEVRQLFAFALWNVDNLFCSHINEYKLQLGAPQAWLLEGHAWVRPPSLRSLTTTD